jgi:hypothetical protein
MPDDRMLLMGTALMQCAPFPKINSICSNAADLRRYSRNVVGVPMGNRPPMTRSYVASELPNSNEVCEQPQGGTPRKPPARWPAVTEFKKGPPTHLQRRGMTDV